MIIVSLSRWGRVVSMRIMEEGHMLWKVSSCLTMVSSLVFVFFFFFVLSLREPCWRV